MSYFRKFDSEVLSSSKLTFIFAALAALSPLGMDTYLPAVPAYSQSLGISSEQASWTLSNFLVGLGLGQVFGGAISDQIGRRPIALCGTLVFFASCIALIFFQSYVYALLFRFLQGVGSGLLMVSGIAMVKDTTNPKGLADRMSQVTFIIMITPLIAPLLGSLLLHWGWQSIFLVCAIAALLMYFFFYLKVPETHSKKTGHFSFISGYKQFVYVVQHRIEGKRVAIFQAFSLTFCASIILMFVTTAPSILMGYYELNAHQFSFAFGTVIIALLVGNRVGKFALKFYAPIRIYAVGIALQFVCASLFFFANIFFSLSLFSFLAGIMFLVACFSSVGPSGQSMYLNLLDKNHGSAVALENTMRFSLGGIIGATAVSLGFQPILSLAVVLFVSISLGCCCFCLCWGHWRKVF